MIKIKLVLALVLLNVCLFAIFQRRCNSSVVDLELTSKTKTENDFEFISGNALEEFADFRMIEGIPGTRQMTTDIVIEKLVNKSIIFVKTDFISDFLRAVRNYRTTFILITHNSGYAMPGLLKEYLIDNPLLIHYFAQNTNLWHQRLTTLPVGIDNAFRKEMNPKRNELGKLVFPEELRDIPPFKVRKTLLFIKFNIETNFKVRSETLNIMQRRFPINSTNVDYGRTQLSHRDYLRRLRDVKFVVSPPGSGIDCHRTWEALIMGCVPIVLNTTISSLYQGQPVMVVNNWSDVSEEVLQLFEQNLNLSGTNGIVRTEIVKASYWKDLILKKRIDL